MSPIVFTGEAAPSPAHDTNYNLEGGKSAPIQMDPAALATEYAFQEVGVLEHSTGTTAFVWAPEHWSTNAVSILANKYMRKTGVPASGDSVVDEDAEHPLSRSHLTQVSSTKAVPAWLLPRKPAPGAALGRETHAHQVFHRLAGCWTYWGWLEGRFSTEQDAWDFYRSIYADLYHQKAAPNSPQWFNTGLHWAYGITGPAQGHWFINAKGEAEKSKDAYSRPQPHACFIQAVSDDLTGEGGIMGLWQREALVFKFGSGTGSNFSSIRAKGEKLSGGGTSSGLMSFLKIGDTVGGAIKSGGTTRRAAKMVCVDVDHPEIEDFIVWKAREEMKAASLHVGAAALVDFSKAIHLANRLLSEGPARPDADQLLRDMLKHWSTRVHPKVWDRFLSFVTAGGDPVTFANMISDMEMSVDWQGEAYETVSGQNANNSVRVSDEFMQAAAELRPWHLTARTTGETMKTVDARGLWDSICESAWACADPGLQFDDTINSWNTLPWEGRINASNPCSEYMFLDDTACNLASLNLVAFAAREPGKKARAFNLLAFADACERWTQVLDTSVTMAQFPSRQMAINSARYRTLGLGYANLGGLLMRMGIAYDSDDGRHLAALITGTLQMSAIRASHRTANTDSIHPAAKAAAYAPDQPEDRQGRNIRDTAVIMLRHLDLFQSVLDVEQHTTGQRRVIDAHVREISRRTSGVVSAVQSGDDLFNNAQLSVLAPTGTISLLMDCDTTGIEPDFALVKYKSLAGGGGMTIVNASVPEGLIALGYKDVGEKADQILSGKHRLDEILDPAHVPVFAVAASNDPSPGAVVSPSGHVQMMAVCQPFISGAISKTVNLPTGATVQDVSSVYREAWASGVKAIALYVDGSKLSQPLNGSLHGPDEIPELPRFNEESETQRMRSILSGSTRQEWKYAPEEPPEYPAAEEYESAGGWSSLSRGQRQRLPNLRESITQRAQINGDSIHVTASFDPSTGNLAEVFASMYGAGSSISGLLDVVAKLASVAMQHGTPAQDVIDVLKGTKFSPAGFVAHHEAIRSATSVTDFIGRHLEYLIDRRERTDNLPTSQEKVEFFTDSAPAAPVPTSGLTGSICSSCGGSRMIRAGSCETCLDCGSTSGCG
jgi:ribonucleoside-diphosphate reductase alpha chain